MPGGLVELRSFFMGGRTGDDVQLSESDGPPGSGLDRFSSFSFVSRSSAGAGEGDTEALGGVAHQHTFISRARRNLARTPLTQDPHTCASGFRTSVRVVPALSSCQGFAHGQPLQRHR